MKVLHLSSEASWRGGEQQIAYLLGELNKHGVESHVAVRSHSAFERWCDKNKIVSIPLAFRNDFDFRSALTLKNYCLRERFDLMHLHSSRSHGIAVLSASLGNKTPLVLSRRVDFKLKSNFLSQWKYNHPSVKKIICVSDAIKKIVGDKIKHPERCLTIYDGVDQNRFAGKGIKGTIRKELNISDDVILIGNVAAVAPHKDYFTFLETAKLLRGKIKAKFLSTGDGPLRNEIAQRIQELNLNDEVIMLGFRNDLENIFADLDLLLYTSKEEGLGSTLLDAMACGVPVVTTDAGGIPEIVKDNYNGLTAPVGNPEKLAEQVIRILNDGDLKNTLVANAESFVKNFSKEKMAEQTLRVYEDVVRDS